MRPSGTLAFILGMATSAAAQCPFTPTVTGELLVCPGGRTTLGTQSYDAYQWFTRPFGSADAQPVQGATGQSYTVDYDDTPVYVSVAATLNNCTERSAEVLVDGRVFLPVVVQTTGSFTISPDGEVVICAGDTVYLISLPPYTIKHQWYNNDAPISGANNDTLVVTHPGVYWLTASPGECPEYTAALGVTISVVWSDVPGCVSSIRDPRRVQASMAPNPASETVEINVAESGPVELRLTDMTGRPLRRQVFVHHTYLPLVDLPGGIYIVHLRTADGGGAQLKLYKM